MKSLHRNNILPPHQYLTLSSIFLNKQAEGKAVCRMPEYATYERRRFLSSVMEEDILQLNAVPNQGLPEGIKIVTLVYETIYKSNKHGSSDIEWKLGSLGVCVPNSRI